MFFGDSSVDLVDIVKLTDTFANKLFAFCYFFWQKGNFFEDTFVSRKETAPIFLR